LEAGDLLVNNSAATNVSGAGLGPYVFTFSPPSPGSVGVAWAAGHGIRDGSSNVFVGGSWSYLIDTNLVVPLAKITEIMAANAATLADEDGDYPDWLEILNPRQTSLNLSNWCLTDNAANLTKWRFPDVNLAPGARLVVFASSKNRATNGTPLHANFSLSSGGEYLALVQPDGVSIVSQFAPAFPPQVADLAYGAIEDTGADAYLLAPTPGAPNSAAFGAARVADTKFSPTRGVYDAPLSVAITTATPGATIRYTTNGSLPSATNGVIYTGPIPVTRSLAIRAAAFKPGCVPANVDTHTYVLPETVLRQSPGNVAPPGWPASSVNGQRFDYEMDARIVNHANTNLGGPAQVLAGLRSLPSFSIVLPQSDFSGLARGIYVNARQRGTNWERAVSVELLNDPEHGSGFHAGAGLRIRGNFSRDGNNPNIPSACCSAASTATRSSAIRSTARAAGRSSTRWTCSRRRIFPGPSLIRSFAITCAILGRATRRARSANPMPAAVGCNSISTESIGASTKSRSGPKPALPRTISTETNRNST